MYHKPKSKKLDKELDGKVLHFIRHADDCNTLYQERNNGGQGDAVGHKLAGTQTVPESERNQNKGDFTNQ